MVNCSVLKLLFAGSLLCGPYLKAQAPVQPASSEILQDLRKLNVLGNVLYMAAHPDDENTHFIGYMANERLYHTSYLSLTRGDGGQNLIGSEMRELLGMIRTQELLQARRTDGGNQYFSRANDFGFSKGPEETFEIWDKEKVLADAVWVIRNVQPDVIVTRFPPDARAGHGHHTASAILAAEAFEAAGDSSRFPEQLRYVSVWKPKRLVWNISTWWITDRAAFERSASAYLKMDLGGFNALLGKSYGEIAAKSRSMHKSQGFGSLGSRGGNIEYFEHVKGEKSVKDLFEGVETSWARINGAQGVAVLVAKAIRDFRADDPAQSLPLLLQIRKEIGKLPDSFWKRTKLGETNRLIFEVLGFYLEATVEQESYARGETMDVRIEAVNRSRRLPELVSLSFPFQGGDSLTKTPLKGNEAVFFGKRVKIPADQPVTQPYWLKKNIGYAGLFEVDDLTEIGKPENTPASLKAVVRVENDTLDFVVPVVYKRKDPVKGEVYQPLVITPPVYVNLGREVYMFETPEAKDVAVSVKAAVADCKGVLKLRLPKGWRAEPAEQAVRIAEKDGTQEVRFRVTPPAKPVVATIAAVVEKDGVTYDRGLGVIGYDHIPRQVYFPESSARAVRLDLSRKGNEIGYIMGAGDAVPETLRELGYRVTVLGEKDLTPANLKRFDAVIAGVRLYNTVSAMKQHQAALFDYVKDGGNFIVQYNTSGDLVVPVPGPYPFVVTRERVTREDAEVRFLDAGHPLLNTPNKITKADFDGWVQERGLYFPEKWDSRYQTVISSNDPGGKALDGGILVAPYGKGHYIYTSLSWFRELPAGVPGACRLFVNMISLGK